MINVWLALRGAPNALIQARLRHNFEDGDYNGPVAERHAVLFQSFHDWETVQGLLKKQGQGNSGYTLWSVNIEDPDAVDDLQATYPGAQVKVLGAWNFDGSQFDSGRWPVDADILDFMPDVWNGDEPPTYSPATVLTDVNLLMGQTPRDFS